MVAAATLHRLVEGLGTGARVDENGIGGVDGRDAVGTSGRSLLSLACGFGLGLSHIRCSSPKYGKYIVGSTAGTTFFTDLDTQTAVLQSRDAHYVTPTGKGFFHFRRAH
jgi:hypothetical protein